MTRRFRSALLLIGLALSLPFCCWALDDDIGDTFETAFAVAVPYAGNLTLSDSDADVFVFLLNEITEVNFDLDAAVPGLGARLEVFNERGTVFCDVQGYGTIDPYSEILLSQGTYYVKITGPELPNPVPYALSISTVPIQDVALPVDGVGYIVRSGAMDVVRFQLSQAATLIIDIDTESGEDSLDTYINLTDAGLQAILWLDNVDGHRDPYAAVPLASGTYYLMIHGVAPGSGPYTLKILYDQDSTSDSDTPDVVTSQNPAPQSATNAAGDFDMIEISLPYRGEHEIEEPGDEDRFQFSLDSETTLRFGIDSASVASSLDSVIVLDRLAGVQPEGEVVSNDDETGRDAGLVETLTEGDYSLTVQGYGESLGRYALLIAPVDEATDIGDTSRTAKPVALPFEGTYVILPNTDADWFSFEISEAATLSVRVEDADSVSLRSLLAVRDTEDDVVALAIGDSGKMPSIQIAVQPGTYTLEVVGVQGTMGMYSIRISVD